MSVVLFDTAKDSETTVRFLSSEKELILLKSQSMNKLTEKIERKNHLSLLTNRMHTRVMKGGLSFHTEYPS